jgi:hypothetical protein
MSPQTQPDPSPDAARVEDRVGGDGPPPAANQRRAEPMPEKTVPTNTGPASTSSGNGATTAAGAPGSSTAQEQSTARPAVAVPGKPDGEVDTAG